MTTSPLLAGYSVNHPIVGLFIRNRQVGSTTALVEAAISYGLAKRKEVVIVAATQPHADQISRMVSNLAGPTSGAIFVRVVALSGLDRLMGTNHGPILVDNHTIQTLINQYADRLDLVTKNSGEMRQEIQGLNLLLDDLQKRYDARGAAIERFRQSFVGKTILTMRWVRGWADIFECLL